jgi:hypothetical protein
LGTRAGVRSITTNNANGTNSAASTDTACTTTARACGVKRKDPASGFGRAGERTPMSTTNGTYGAFHYPVDRDFISAVDRILAEYHPQAEADFERKKEAREDTSNHIIHPIMKVLSEMTSAEEEFEAYRTGRSQIRDLTAALVTFARAYPLTWLTNDDGVDSNVMYARRSLEDRICSVLSSIESLGCEMPADVRRILNRWANSKER